MDKRTRRIGGLLGALTGFVSFLAVGLVPAVLYGGWTGLVMAGAMLGRPVPQTLVAKALILGGIVLGVLAVAALFLVVGALLGSGAAYVVAVFRRGLEAREAETAAVREKR